MVTGTHVSQLREFSLGLRTAYGMAQEARQHPETAQAIIDTCRAHGIWLEARRHFFDMGVLVRVTSLARADSALQETLATHQVAIAAVLLLDEDNLF